MTREFADVALGGLTIGFAFVEIDAAGNAVDLASPGLLSCPSPAAPEVNAGRRCPCRAEDLAFARVKSRCGAGWSLGVKVCPAHRCLHAA
jgi:hypothetical protein